MCSNDNSQTATLVPYTLNKSMSESNPACTAAAAATAAAAYMSINPNLTQAALDHYRLQLYNYASYADRFRYTHPAIATHFALAAGGGAGAGSPYGHHHHAQVAHHHHHHAEGMFAAALASPYAKFDPRAFRLHQEEPKPQHSYIGLIGMAILSSPDKKLVLSDIYQYILDNYAYFRSRGPGWRNSIRHNLSLNDCFIKSGRSANGKGHYWAIHPANLEDFKKGDFRRRKAQRRVRKHMGLAVPDDEDSVSPPPQPTLAPPNSVGPPTRPLTPGTSGVNVPVNLNGHGHLWSQHRPKPDSTTTATTTAAMLGRHHITVPLTTTTLLPILAGRRRQFDMESLLAPDRPSTNTQHGMAAAMLRSVEAHHHHHHHHLQNRTATSAAGQITSVGPRYVQTDTVYPRRQSLINGGRLMMVQVPDHHHHQLHQQQNRPMNPFEATSVTHLKDGGWKMSGDVEEDVDTSERRQQSLPSGGQADRTKEPNRNATESDSNRLGYANRNKKFKSEHTGSELTDEAKSALVEDTREIDTEMLDSRSWNGDEEEEEDEEQEHPDHEQESCCSDSDNRTAASPCSPEGERGGGGAGGSDSTRLSPATSARTSGRSGSRPQSGDGSAGSDSPMPDTEKDFVGGGTGLNASHHHPHQQHRSPASSPFGGYTSRSGPAARALVCVAAAAAASAASSSNPSGHLCHVSMCSPTLVDSPWHKSFLQHQNGTGVNLVAAPASVSPQPYRLGPLQHRQHHHQQAPTYAVNGVQCTTPVGAVRSSPGLSPLGSSFSSNINNQLSITGNANTTDVSLSQTLTF